jgi:hypothetical protein
VKVALIQLPLQSHDYIYSLENIPLAAGYLKSYASARNAPADIIICPQDIANLGGDAAVLRWVEHVRPDMVGFSCYLWNVQRTLHLCSLIRQRLEDCLIVLGGPEVTTDNDFLASHDCFHFGVVGEGEETFVELIRSVMDGQRDFPGVKGLIVRRDSKVHFSGRRGRMKDLDAIPSPYLKGFIGPSLNRSMLMETVRGCPMRCTYCYYHKSSPHVRAFAIERINEEFTRARDGRLDEVTIIDPCFARRPDLDSLLAAIAPVRSGRLRFSCELNAEDLTPAIVDDLVRAGLAHVEIGLQSTNEKALRTIGRRFMRDDFIRGVKMLRSKGVRVVTDIMAGLPGDTLDDVKRSIDFVLTEDLCDDLSLYPLSILPGTLLRRQVRHLGINHQCEPPYLVTQTSDMGCEDIREAFRYAEDATGRDFFPVELPRTDSSKVHGHGTIIHRIVIDGKDDGPDVSPDEIGQALCIKIYSHDFISAQESLKERVQALLAKNPFTLVSWVMPEEAYRGSETIEGLSCLCSKVVHPSDREYMATFTPERSCRLFLEGRTTSGGVIYTQVPIHPDASRPIWAGLPVDAVPEEELLHKERMERLLGFKPDIRYHDLEDTSPDVLDDLLSSRYIKA